MSEDLLAVMFPNFGSAVMPGLSSWFILKQIYLHGVKPTPFRYIPSNILSDFTYSGSVEGPLNRMEVGFGKRLKLNSENGVYFR